MSRETKIKDIKIVRTGLDNIDEEQNNFVWVGTEGCIPKNRDVISLYADEPCVEACQLLYDLNIQTFTSGGHVDGKENEEGIAFIGIIYKSLSEENKQIAKQMIERGIIGEFSNNRGEGHDLTIFLKVPINSNSLVGEVSDKLLQLASLFQQQDVLYGMQTIEEIQTELFTKIDDETYRDNILYSLVSKEQMQKLLPEYVECQCENMYTSDGITYFVSEDLLIKHLNYVNGINAHKKK